MQVDISINDKTLESTVSFQFINMNTEMDFKQCVAILCMVCADYYLDPELGVEDMQEFKAQGLEKGKAKMTFSASEEGLELEFED